MISPTLKLGFTPPEALDTIKFSIPKNFIFDGTNEQKNEEINKIKSTIKADY